MLRSRIRGYDPGVPSTYRYPDWTVPDLLRRSALRFPNSIALLFYGRGIRFKELDELTTRFALSLRSLGVGPGDRLALMLPNTPQAVIGYYGALKAGAIVPARLDADGYEDTGDHLARLARLSFTSDGADPVASVPVPGGVVEILPSAEVDPGAAERKRSAQRAKLEKDIEQSERKLANRGFVDKAPQEVVAAEREKLERLRAELEAL